LWWQRREDSTLYQDRPEPASCHFRTPPADTVTVVHDKIPRENHSLRVQRSRTSQIFGAKVPVMRFNSSRAVIQRAPGPSSRPVGVGRFGSCTTTRYDFRGMATTIPADPTDIAVSFLASFQSFLLRKSELGPKTGSTPLRCCRSVLAERPQRPA